MINHIGLTIFVFSFIIVATIFHALMIRSTNRMFKKQLLLIEIAHIMEDEAVEKLRETYHQYSLAKERNYYGRNSHNTP